MKASEAEATRNEDGGGYPVSGEAGHATQKLSPPALREAFARHTVSCVHG